MALRGDPRHRSFRPAPARYDRPAPSLDGYDSLLEASSPRMSETAAQAAIGAAAKELRLPTVRKEALRLAWSGRDAVTVRWSR